MKHIKLRELDVSRIGLGAMGMSHGYTGAGSDDAESIRTIHRALELGVTLLDTAEIYGPYTNEELLERAIKGRRDQVVVATKFGMISHAGGGPGVTGGVGQLGALRWPTGTGPGSVRVAGQPACLDVAPRCRRVLDLAGSGLALSRCCLLRP